MMRKVSVWLLEKAERFFLKSHGWTYVKDGGWSPPGSYPFRRKSMSYARGHAINAQKQAVYNPMHGGYRERN